MALYRLDLPMDDGEPIVEYQNNHWILYIDKLDTTRESSIWGIVKGIIGSTSEEEGRCRLDWQERKCYLLPRKEGIACGWIHKLKINVSDGNGTTGDTTKNEDDTYSVDGTTFTDRGTVKDVTSDILSKISSNACTALRALRHIARQ